ncbi:hypothetical protein IE077_002436 [Cardiosporidium cionae]|uniref:Uncharacterized protein n=1 Tax=Cardiosporidium cionae TaxID=476202 RepID=A0ABQ7JAU8_9APIC|nr:hypothetical protein IE077_002436 [Cardiosporidium cionae]|eukprot:KAF8821132.1 hypothetical protein IE077_002436 [Cardiosporidium cionae]
MVIVKLICSVLRSEAKESRLDGIIGYDWKFDSKGQEYLDYSMFCDAMFQLADIWSPVIDGMYYSTFLEKLLNRITVQLITTNSGETVRNRPHNVVTLNVYALEHSLETRMLEQISKKPLSGVQSDSNSACLVQFGEDIEFADEDYCFKSPRESVYAESNEVSPLGQPTQTVIQWIQKQIATANECYDNTGIDTACPFEISKMPNADDVEDSPLQQVGVSHISSWKFIKTTAHTLAEKIQQENAVLEVLRDRRVYYKEKDNKVHQLWSPRGKVDTRMDDTELLTESEGSLPSRTNMVRRKSAGDTKPYNRSRRSSWMLLNDIRLEDDTEDDNDEGILQLAAAKIPKDLTFQNSSQEKEVSISAAFSPLAGNVAHFITATESPTVKLENETLLTEANNISHDTIEKGTAINSASKNTLAYDHPQLWSREEWSSTKSSDITETGPSLQQYPDINMLQSNEISSRILQQQHTEDAFPLERADPISSLADVTSVASLRNDANIEFDPNDAVRDVINTNQIKQLATMFEIPTVSIYSVPSNTSSSCNQMAIPEHLDEKQAFHYTLSSENQQSFTDINPPAVCIHTAPVFSSPVVTSYNNTTTELEANDTVGDSVNPSQTKRSAPTIKIQTSSIQSVLSNDSSRRNQTAISECLNEKQNLSSPSLTDYCFPSPNFTQPMLTTYSQPPMAGHIDTAALMRQRPISEDINKSNPLSAEGSALLQEVYDDAVIQSESKQSPISFLDFANEGSAITGAEDEGRVAAGISASLVSIPATLQIDTAALMRQRPISEDINKGNPLSAHSVSAYFRMDDSVSEKGSVANKSSASYSALEDVASLRGKIDLSQGSHEIVVKSEDLRRFSIKTDLMDISKLFSQSVKTMKNGMDTEQLVGKRESSSSDVVFNSFTKAHEMTFTLFPHFEAFVLEYAKRVVRQEAQNKLGYENQENNALTLRSERENLAEKVATDEVSSVEPKMLAITQGEKSNSDIAQVVTTVASLANAAFTRFECVAGTDKQIAQFSQEEKNSFNRSDEKNAMKKLEELDSCHRPLPRPVFLVIGPTFSVSRLVAFNLAARLGCLWLDPNSMLEQTSKLLSKLGLGSANTAIQRLKEGSAVAVSEVFSVYAELVAANSAYPRGYVIAIPVDDEKGAGKTASLQKKWNEVRLMCFVISDNRVTVTKDCQYEFRHFFLLLIPDFEEEISQFRWMSQKLSESGITRNTKFTGTALQIGEHITFHNIPKDGPESIPVPTAEINVDQLNSIDTFEIVPENIRERLKMQIHAVQTLQREIEQKDLSAVTIYTSGHKLSGLVDAAELSIKKNTVAMKLLYSPYPKPLKDIERFYRARKLHERYKDLPVIEQRLVGYEWSKWRNACPVEGTEKNIIQRGNPDLAVEFGGELYLLNDTTSQQKLLKSPFSYLDIPSNVVSHTNVLILGPPRSGKKSQASALASLYGLKHVDIPQIIAKAYEQYRKRHSKAIVSSNMRQYLQSDSIFHTKTGRRWFCTVNFANCSSQDNSGSDVESKTLNECCRAQLDELDAVTLLTGRCLNFPSVVKLLEKELLCRECSTLNSQCNLVNQAIETPTKFAGFVFTGAVESDSFISKLKEINITIHRVIAFKSTREGYSNSYPSLNLPSHSVHCLENHCPFPVAIECYKSRIFEMTTPLVYIPIEISEENALRIIRGTIDPSFPNIDSTESLSGWTRLHETIGKPKTEKTITPTIPRSFFPCPNSLLGPIGRFCPVLFKTEGWLFPGREELSAQFQNKRYLFSNSAHLDRFIHSPEEFVPNDNISPPPSRIMILGPCGSGVSTHISLLSQAWGWNVLNLEDAVISAIKAEFYDRTEKMTPESFGMLSPFEREQLRRDIVKKSIPQNGELIIDDTSKFSTAELFDSIVLCTYVEYHILMTGRLGFSIKRYETVECAASLLKDQFRLPDITIFLECSDKIAKFRFQEKAADATFRGNSSNADIEFFLSCLLPASRPFNAVSMMPYFVSQTVSNLKVEHDSNNSDSTHFGKAEDDFLRKKQRQEAILEQTRAILIDAHAPFVSIKADSEVGLVQATIQEIIEEFFLHKNEWFNKFNCQPISPETADILLNLSMATISPFIYFSPMDIDSMHPYSFIQKWACLLISLLTYRRNPFPVHFQKKIYFLNSKEELKRFCNSPLQYLHGMNTSTELICPTVLVLGPPLSGKTALAKAVAAALGSVNVSAERSIEQLIGNDSYWGRVIRDLLRRGKAVTGNLLFKCLAWKLNTPECIAEGWVVDDFPLQRKSAINLCRARLSPIAVIILQFAKHEIDERSKFVLENWQDSLKDCKKKDSNARECVQLILIISDNALSLELQRFSIDTVIFFRARYENFLRHTLPVWMYYEKSNSDIWCK